MEELFSENLFLWDIAVSQINEVVGRTVTKTSTKPPSINYRQCCRCFHRMRGSQVISLASPYIQQEPSGDSAQNHGKFRADRMHERWRCGTFLCRRHARGSTATELKSVYAHRVGFRSKPSKSPRSWSLPPSVFIGDILGLHRNDNTWGWCKGWRAGGQGVLVLRKVSQPAHPTFGSDNYSCLIEPC